MSVYTELIEYLNKQMADAILACSCKTTATRVYSIDDMYKRYRDDKILNNFMSMIPFRIIKGTKEK